MKYFIFAIFISGWFNFAFAEEKIDVNSAPLEELTKIIYIGEVRAKELISLRPFSSLDDLARIKGIGEKSVEAIKKQGLAWVAPAPKASLPEPNPAAAKEPEPGANIPPAEATATPESVEPNELILQNHNYPLVLPAAITLSILSGGVIFLLKRKGGVFRHRL